MAGRNRKGMGLREGLRDFSTTTRSGWSDTIYPYGILFTLFSLFKEDYKFTLLTASIKPFNDGVLSMRASKTSSDSFRTYSSTNRQSGMRREKEKWRQFIHESM